MDEEDEFGADETFVAALADEFLGVQTKPQTIQPTPQSLDRAAPLTSASGSRVVQPSPQILTSRSSTSTIQVSARQKGNPILAHLRSFAWEYAEILPDYVLGQTTCALFLSLKYHRLHPEYIYNRIKGLQGKYKLRVLLTLVDITNHEDSLRELAKTSMVNNVTVILCWSAAEAARYLELYKSYENSPKDGAGIKGIEKKGYAEKMVEFITVPRGINKTDAVSIVSAFGSIRAAVNARPEEIAIIGGWGEKKVKRWCNVMDEPFLVKKTTKGGRESFGAIPSESMSMTSTDGMVRAQVEDHPVQDEPEFNWDKGKETELDTGTGDIGLLLLNDERDKDTMNNAALGEEERIAREKRREQAKKDEDLSSGLMAALAKLRETG
ncbi:hypothetical protein K3495_g12474 [Podosphaera aphanis]|nr:hypothetical protein K3495_g12474 [Podosphaera aphanis]